MLTLCVALVLAGMCFGVMLMAVVHRGRVSRAFNSGVVAGLKLKKQIDELPDTEMRWRARSKPLPPPGRLCKCDVVFGRPHMHSLHQPDDSPSTGQQSELRKVLWEFVTAWNMYRREATEKYRRRKL
jgi:hypothetical protein